MTRDHESDRELTLLEAVALAAERLLGASEQPRLPEVLGALGQAAAVSRVALVAARDSPGDTPPRMEIRHQWTAPGVPRLHPANTGWPRYPDRWHSELRRGSIIAGPLRSFPAAERAAIEGEGTGCRSLMLVPISVGERWYGHLELCEATAARNWSNDEIEAIRAAAGIIGSGIAQRQTLATMERRTAILGSAGEATSLLLEATNWRAALPRVLEGIRAATRARSAWAYGPDPGQPGRRATLLYEVLAPGARPGGGHARILEFTPEAAALLARGHHVHDRLPASDPDHLRAALMPRGVASWVMVPIDLGSGAIGVVGLDSELARTWGEGETEGLHVLAGALGAAMRRGGTLVTVPIVASPWGTTPSTGALAADPARVDEPAVEVAVERPRSGEGPGNLS